MSRLCSESNHFFRHSEPILWINLNYWCWLFNSNVFWCRKTNSSFSFAKFLFFINLSSFADFIPPKWWNSWNSSQMSAERNPFDAIVGTNVSTLCEKPQTQNPKWENWAPILSSNWNCRNRITALIRKKIRKEKENVCKMPVSLKMEKILFSKLFVAYGQFFH